MSQGLQKKQKGVTHLLPSGPVMNFRPTALLVSGEAGASLSFAAVRLGRPFLPKCIVVGFTSRINKYLNCTILIFVSF